MTAKSATYQDGHPGDNGQRPQRDAAPMRCSWPASPGKDVPSTVTRERQAGATVRWPCAPTGWPELDTHQRIARGGEDVINTDPCVLLLRIKHDSTTVENSVAAPQKNKQLPSNFTPGA